jgi:hypothetical protein
MEERPPIWRVAVNKLNKQPRKPTRDGPPAWVLGEVLTTPLRKNHMLRITHELRCFLWRQNNPEVNCSPTRISGGGGGSVFRESITQPYQVAGTCGYGEGLSGSINVGNFLTSCKVHWLASQEGLCSME